MHVGDDDDAVANQYKNATTRIRILQIIITHALNLRWEAAVYFIYREVYPVVIIRPETNIGWISILLYCILSFPFFLLLLFFIWSTCGCCVRFTF